MEKKLSTVDKRIAQEKLLLLEHLKTTPIVEMACSKANIGRASYYRWRKDDPEFARAADDALYDGSLLVNDVAEGFLVSAIRDKNMSAITLWLRTHHPAYSSKLEINGSIHHTREDLTPQEQAAAEEALRLASLVLREGMSQLRQDYEK